MFNLLLLLPKFFATLFYDQQSLVLENLALRQQLSILQRSVKRPQFTNTRSLLLDPIVSILEPMA